MFENIIQLAKMQKEYWVEHTERGDINPTIIGEKDGEVRCMVIAPQVDKELAIRGADIIRQSYDIDGLSLVLDAHFAKAKEGESEEEFTKRYPPGSMQKKCDEEGACETGEIVDCLVCVRAVKTSPTETEMQMFTIPYSYHGKGSTFKWLPNEMEAPLKSKSDGGGVKGFIPRALHQILTTDRLCDTELRSVVEEFGDSDLNRTMVRACNKVLTSEGFVVQNV